MLLWRAIECGVLFVVLPIALALRHRRVNPIPILLIVAAIATVMLMRDPTFDFGSFASFPRPLDNLRYILMLLPIGAAGLFGLLSYMSPDDRFKLLRKKPRVWAMVMLLYPLMSVIPQTIIYRVFFMHRYQVLFGNDLLMLTAATLAFGLGHVIFRHPLPVILTTIGGLLFAWRFMATGSAGYSAIEHALYGNLAFTIGFSRYLYHASTRMAESLVVVGKK
jgi:hypothetical protein